MYRTADSPVPDVSVCRLCSGEFRAALGSQFGRAGSNSSSCFCFGLPESDLGQKDVGFLSECVLRYLKDLQSPLIPACLYPQLQTAVSLKQQALNQAPGGSKQPVQGQASGLACAGKLQT